MITTISVYRDSIRGYIELSAIVNGYRESRTYYGYSVRDALRLFRQYLQSI